MYYYMISNSSGYETNVVSHENKYTYKEIKLMLEDDYNGTIICDEVVKFLVDYKGFKKLDYKHIRLEHL